MRWWKRLSEWLEEEAYGKNVFFIMVAAVVFCLSWSATALFLIRCVSAGAALASIVNVLRLDLYSPFILFALAFFEELLFRLPLALFVRVGWSLNRVLIIAIAISMYFGFSHGGVSHIFVQGVDGFIFSMVFLKCGGWQKHYAKALLASSTTHFMYNGVLMCLA
ncbi:MAG: CPBP family intramembrane metalloprotease [Candidatus Niyogibacteria bacterium]|nr:CPBP family intramembrane metalloprotease [Candidatus Niyogibacteria bacterium]